MQEGHEQLEDLGIDELREHMRTAVDSKYQDQIDRHPDDAFAYAEKQVLLGTVDTSWKDHLLALDHLREGIGLRAHGQRDPKNEYKRESYELFQDMKDRIEDTVIKTLFRLEPITEEQLEELQRRRQRMAPAPIERSSPASAGALPPGIGPSGPAPGQPGGPPLKPQTIVRKGEKIGRNDPCPCGSGKKYKKCHGRSAA